MNDVGEAISLKRLPREGHLSSIEARVIAKIALNATVAFAKENGLIFTGWNELGLIPGAQSDLTDEVNTLTSELRQSELNQGHTCELERVFSDYRAYKTIFSRIAATLIREVLNLPNPG